MKNISKIQKAVISVSLVTLVAIIIFLIAAIFGLSSPMTWKIVLSLLYILAGCVFSTSALTFTSKNKVLAYVSIGLIWLAVIGAMIATFGQVDVTFVRTEGTLAIATAFLVILIGTILKTNGRLKGMQIIFSILTIILDGILTFQVWGGHLFKIKMFTEFFIAFVIVDTGILVAINILSRKTISDEAKVTITREEYEILKEKARKYDELKKGE